MNFEKLTYHIKDKLFRFALRITGNKPEAEDVVQEVFLKIWDKRDEMSTVLNQEAWCMTLTKNLAFDKIKSKHRKTDDIDEAFNLQDSKTNVYQTVETSDTMAVIKQIMSQLPDNQRLVMHLRDIEDMTYEEIAVSLEMPMSQVKVNLHRARQKVREQLLNLEQ
jgi:RNA polymerase sigma factor (sigma-70 family)